jgi:HEPN domain-containing protein
MKCVSGLQRAQHDLASARKLCTEPEPYLDTAVCHCQQAAEKAVKGFLTCHGQRFRKTHDIEVLVSIAVPIDGRFSAWLAAGQLLTPYATAFRYPGEMLEPDHDEFEEALRASEAFYSFVLSLLPADVHPAES